MYLCDFDFMRVCKKSKNDCLYNTMEPGRDFQLFLEISKATDTKQACSGYDTKTMAVYFFGEITAILLWYVENNS